MPAASEPSVDYGKLDAPLAGALSQVADADAPSLQVFIHLDDPEAAMPRLVELGVAAHPASAGPWTATLSARQVAELSGQPWVRQLRLSGRLRLL